MEKEVAMLEKTVKFCCLDTARMQDVDLKKVLGLHKRTVRFNNRAYDIVIVITDKDIDDYKENLQFA